MNNPLILNRFTPNNIFLNIPEPYLKCDGHQSTITKRKTRIVVIDKWSDNVCGVVFAC